VAARGIGQQHRQRDKEDEESELPLIVCDYAYLADTSSEGTLPILVLRDRKTKLYAASAVQATGVNAYALKFVVGVVQDLGWKRLIFKSDNEPAIVALKRAVAKAMPGVEVILQESPVGDHAANGEAENAVKEIKRQIRVLKSVMDEKMGTAVRADHPILSWLPRHCAECLSRYRIGQDGKTAEQRRTGRR